MPIGGPLLVPAGGVDFLNSPRLDRALLLRDRGPVSAGSLSLLSGVSPESSAESAESAESADALRALHLVPVSDTPSSSHTTVQHLD